MESEIKMTTTLSLHEDRRTIEYVVVTSQAALRDQLVGTTLEGAGGKCFSGGPVCIVMERSFGDDGWTSHIAMFVGIDDRWERVDAPDDPAWARNLNDRLIEIDSNACSDFIEAVWQLRVAHKWWDEMRNAGTGEQRVEAQVSYEEAMTEVREITDGMSRRNQMRDYIVSEATT